MFIEANVTAALATSRVLRSGEDKGESRHTANIYAVATDGVPVQFSVTCGSEQEARDLVGKYQAGTKVRVQIVPRDVFWADAHQLVIVK